MITVLVQFPLPAGLRPESYDQFCRDIAPTFRTPEGLVRKNFLVAEDGRSAGGVYLWRSRDAADRFYTPGFRARIARQWGVEPAITYFRTPVVVDNTAGRIEVA